MQVEKKEVKTIAELVCIPSLRYGDKDIVLREETPDEKGWRESGLGKTATSNFRMEMQFSDKSVKYFSLLTEHGKDYAEQEAIFAVHEFLAELKLERVVWRIENGPYHITSGLLPLKKKRAGIISRAADSIMSSNWKQRIHNFFYLDETDFE